MSSSATSTSRRSSFGRSSETQLWTSFSEKLHVHIGPNSITWDEDISVWRQDIDDDLTILDDMFSDDSADFHTPLASLEDQEYRDRIGFVFRGLLSARTLLQVDCPLDPDLKKIVHNEKQYDWTNPAARKAMIDRTMIYTHWLIYMDKIQEDLSECTDCTERRSIEVDLAENQRYAICCSALQESKQIFREYKGELVYLHRIGDRRFITSSRADLG